MKSGLAAAMIAAAAIRRSGASLAGRLVVGALVDEEGDMLGARHFCTTPIGRELSAAIVCEPEQNELCLEQRGVIWARVTARGRMAHGAMPEAGANPISALAALVAGAPRRRPRLDRRHHLENGARDPDRHLRPGPPADPASGGRIRRGRGAGRRRAHLHRRRARVSEAVTRARRPRLRGVEAFPVEHEGTRFLALRDPAGYTSSTVLLPLALLEIVSLFDGGHDVASIQQAVLRQRGEQVDAARIEELAQALDAHGFLEGPAFEARRAEVDGVFLATPMRPASHAGGAYPARAGGRGLRRASRGAGRAGLLCRRAGAPQRALDRVPGRVPPLPLRGPARGGDRAGAHELRARGAGARQAASG